MDVSVIIVNYNTRQMTSECIDSLFEKTFGIDFEIILVDNGSTDGSKEYFEKDKKIKYIYSNENLGFGRANNLGFKYSSGKYIFLLNSDTLLINNAIKILKDFLETNSHASIVGGQLYNIEYIPVHSYSMLFPSVKWELDIFLNGSITTWLLKKNQKTLKERGYMQVAYITGADMMIRRSDIDMFGFFNPQFFMYFEETELTMRFSKNGRYAYFYPEAKIIHLENASFKIKAAREKMFFESREKLYRLYKPIFECEILNAIYYVTCISRIILFFNKKEKREYWIERFKIFKSR